MKARVNENCIGCGLCPNLCPAVFTMTDAGVAAAKNNGEVAPEYADQTQEAAESCPVDAIETEA